VARRTGLYGRCCKAWLTRLSAFNPAAFKTPAPGTFGNLGRGVLIGPGMVNTDVSFQKTFRLGERFTASYRLECFNLLDRINYLSVQGSMASSMFGQVNSSTYGWSGLGAVFRLSF
jgi:hypothetical protein